MTKSQSHTMLMTAAEQEVAGHVRLFMAAALRRDTTGMDRCRLAAEEALSRQLDEAEAGIREALREGGF